MNRMMLGSLAVALVLGCMLPAPRALAQDTGGRVFDFPADVTMPRPKVGCCGDGYAGTEAVVIVDGIGRGGRAKTIQQGIRRARPGGTVKVLPHPNGAYVENLKIKKPVTIEGPSDPDFFRDPMHNRHVILRPAKATEPCVEARIDGPGIVAISGLTIVPSMEGNRQLAHCIDVRVSEFKLAETTVNLATLSDLGYVGDDSRSVTGVAVQADKSTIERSAISGGDIGVAIISRKAGTHTLADNWIYSNAVGLRVSGEGTVNADRNMLFGNRDAGFENVNGSGRFAENTVDSNGIGVRLIYSPEDWENGLTISGNLIRSNSGAGVLFAVNRCEQVEGSVIPGITITGNTIEDNGGAAFEWLGKGKPKKSWFKDQNKLDHNKFGELRVTMPSTCRSSFSLW